jgi:acyl carrier protein
LACVEEVIVTILEAHCRVTTEFRPELRLAEDLGLDSIGLLTLALELENHYRVRLEENPENPPTTLGELAELVEGRL